MLRSSTLCPCLCLSLRDIPYSRGSQIPPPESRAVSPITITQLTQFTLFRLLCLHLSLPIPSSVFSLPVTKVTSVSPPRPIIASSPLSLVVLGTNLLFALLKIIFCIGQICRLSEPQFPHLLKAIMDIPSTLSSQVCLLLK